MNGFRILRMMSGSENASPCSTKTSSLLQMPPDSSRWKSSRFIFVRCRPGALWIVWFRNSGICWCLLCTATDLRSTKTTTSADTIYPCPHITDSLSSGMSMCLSPEHMRNCPSLLYRITPYQYRMAIRSASN